MDCNNYTGIYKKYYDVAQTQLFIDAFVINGKFEGKYEQYYRNGTLNISTYFVNGQIHEDYIQYRYNGFIILHKIYQYGNVVETKFDLINKPYIYN